MLLHIPHYSTYIPKEYRDLFVISDEALAEEIQLMTDHHTDKMFGLEHPNIKRVSAEVSRLLVDMERFRDDKDESMAEKGMGAVYTRRHDGTPLKTFTPEQREALLQRYYDPHHKAIEEAVQKELDEHGECLIIDCHSFPDDTLPYEDRGENYEAVDFCIGFDSFHKSEEHIVDIWQFLVDKGYEVALNSPFAGSIVPSKFFEKDERVSSVMIEVNRKLDRNEVKELMNVLLPYLAGDTSELNHNSFSEDNAHRLPKINNWTYEEGEVYLDELFDGLSNKDNLHEKCFFKSMELTFSSTSCSCSISLWMEVAHFFTQDLKLDSIEVAMAGGIYSRPTDSETQVDGSIMYNEGDDIENVSSEGGYGLPSDLIDKFVNMVKSDYQTDINDPKTKKEIERSFVRAL